MTFSILFPPRRRSFRSAAATLAILALTACNERGPSQPGPPVLDLEEVATGFTAPVLLREAPDGSGRLFVVDQAGLIRIIDGGDVLATPFLDLRSRMVQLNAGFDERGLLGLAFHPQYATNGRFFVYYSAPLRPGAPADFNHTSHISEFSVSADPAVADPGSERILLQVDQPQFNHNAGTVAFGPDGYLYISLGDGGGANDVGVGHVEDWYDGNPGGNAQNVEANLLGKILRIDVDGAQPYGIPADNPFVGSAGLDEIYAWGFRNPYRFSFDQQTGQLIAGDAGQNRWEEVSVVVRGGNYGWNVKEASECFDALNPDDGRDSCPDTGEFGEPLIDPVIEYRHANLGGPGIVVIGGFVYRGSIPQLSGRYIFGDFSRTFQARDGVVFLAQPAGQAASWPFEEIRFGAASRTLGAFLLGFGQDLDGEVYVLTSQEIGPVGTTGAVQRIIRR